MILVVGATGQLGGRITRELLARGKTVRMLVRPESHYATLAALGAEASFGDLRDRASLDAACLGVSSVITTANSARRAGADSVEAVDLNGTRSLIDAAAAAGVRQFIYTSVLGATESHPAPFLAAKAKNETHLRASGMNWTILAPNAFQESWPLMVVGVPALMDHPISFVGEGHRKHTFVSEGDVASFALTALDHPAGANKHIPIGGPEALSWRDIVAIYERLLGHPLQVLPVPPGKPIPGIPDVVLGYLAALDTYDSAFDAGVVAGEFGVRLTPFEEVARAQIAGRAAAH
jgi:uncharacterized protein YbjT (DUF2867 family)